MKSNNINSNGENVVAINLKLFYLKIVKIEFKIKLQSLFYNFGAFPGACKTSLSISFTLFIKMK